MKIRDYQRDARAAVRAEYHRGRRSTLVIKPTGTGKTVLFAFLADDFRPFGRTLVVAHREELIAQAADKIRAVTGIDPEIEKAQSWANAGSSLVAAGPFVVASVQTLTSGPRDRRRMHRLDPSTFALVIIDEGHRATAATYREVIAHFGQNPECRFLLVTATGDRSDGEGLGSVAESVAYEMNLQQAVQGGWLVPVRQTSVTVEGLDFSKVRSIGGDLDAEELAAVMDLETVLHPIVHASLEVAWGLERGTLATLRDDDGRRERLAGLVAGRTPRPSLVFAPSVALAERLADIFGRWMPESAACVHGKTDPEVRRQLIDGFRRRRFPFLVNVGIATEGFDAPVVEVVVNARPTKSRVLFTQMLGRGTRPSEAVAGQLGELPDAAARLAAIANSDKPHMTVLDFVGNCGKHRLVTAVDVLAGKHCDPSVLDAALEIVRAGEVEDVGEAIANAEVEADAARAVAVHDADHAQAELDLEDDARTRDILAAPMHKLRHLVGTAEYTTAELAGVSATGEAFGHGAALAPASRPTATGGSTEGQIKMLKGFGVGRATAAGYSRQQASAVIDSYMQKQCTSAQRYRLQREGYAPDAIDRMNYEAASRAIDAAASSERRAS